jgi:hypothetical protein
MVARKPSLISSLGTGNLQPIAAALSSLFVEYNL